MEPSWERLVPEVVNPAVLLERRALEEHVARYRFAADLLGADAPLRVLDLACGVGYGTRLLRDALHPASELTGVDIDAWAIEYAERHYGGDGVRFVAADATGFGRPRGYDAIVSFETIEHLPDPLAFLLHLRELLVGGGRLVASVPVVLTTDLDRFHLHDFSERSFRGIVETAGFGVAGALRQTYRYWLGTALRDLWTKSRETTPSGRLPVRPGLARYYLLHPEKLLRRLWSALPAARYKTLTLVLEKPCSAS
jgi:SAM-dependent methyltransferase